MWERLFAVADRALYHAKASGRKRAVGVFPAQGVRMDPELIVRAIRTVDLKGIEASGLVEVVHEDRRLASGPIGLVPAPVERETPRPAAEGRSG